MGKAGDAEQAVSSHAPAAGNCSAVRRYAAAIGRALDAKCVLVMFLSIGILLLAVFMLLPLHASKSIPDDHPGILPAYLSPLRIHLSKEKAIISPGEIQASFFLLKKREQLISHVRSLQKEIYREIGVPNTTVSVSMYSSQYRDSTHVKFGIIPSLRNSPISAQSKIALRKKLIQLTLEQFNLSLTQSVFGDPYCLEILEFPGGITVPLPPDGNICLTPLFNVTLNTTIHQLKVNFKDLENVLRIVLQLTPEEELIVEITNENGSTIDLPVTVQISIACLETYRVKQLSHTITKLIPKNLGLNSTIFGIIDHLWLPPHIKSSIPPSAPNPAPAPSLFPSNPQHSQPTTTKPNGSFPCPSLETRKTVSAHRRLSTISPTMEYQQGLIVGVYTLAGKIDIHWQNQSSLFQHPHQNRLQLILHLFLQYDFACKVGMKRF
uniref:DUF7036 domain-containing protein n=1 Tax=Leersia perrieri TaxID=77586 RepID=A0A0D9VLH7_9ORYZ